MLLDYCLENADELDAELTRTALEKARDLAAKRPLPLDVEPEVLVAIAYSTLYHNAKTRDRETAGPEGSTVRVIENVPAIAENEYARLMGKGRDLFDHCLSQKSKVCVTGFMEYELKKKNPPRRALFDLVAWMVERRIEISESEKLSDEDRAVQTAWADVMIDESIGVLHGLNASQAEELAAERRP